MHIYLYQISRKTIDQLKQILLPNITRMLDECLVSEADYTETKEEYDDAFYIPFNVRNFSYRNTKRVEVPHHIADPTMWYYRTSSPYDADYPEMLIVDQILCAIGECLQSL
jgi:hypothetical protein